MQLRGKKCFVTGAASGMGRATAQRLGAEGARLILTDIDGPGLARAVAELRAGGAEVLAQRALDVTSAEAVSAFAAHLHAEHGSMDALLNVAGISVWGAVDQLTHEHFRRCIEVNLMGPVHVLTCFLPAMIAARRGGHVVNVASAAGLLGLPWHAAYSASKFGLRGISEVLRFDLRQHGIGVSLVCPGAVDTPLVRTVQLVGIDTSRPDVQALRARFQRHAVSPEAAARAIVRGMKHDEYMVFTSPDIRLGYWLQRRCEPLYALAMRVLGARVEALAKVAVGGAASTAGLP